MTLEEIGVMSDVLERSPDQSAENCAIRHEHTLKEYYELAGVLTDRGVR